MLHLCQVREQIYRFAWFRCWIQPRARSNVKCGVLHQDQPGLSPASSASAMQVFGVDWGLDLAHGLVQSRARIFIDVKCAREQIG